MCAHHAAAGGAGRGGEDVQVQNNYIGITEDANTMFAKVLSISDTLMWDWYTLLSFRSLAEIANLKAEVAEGATQGRQGALAKTGNHGALSQLRPRPMRLKKTSTTAPRAAFPTISPICSCPARRWALAAAQAGGLAPSSKRGQPPDRRRRRARRWRRGQRQGPGWPPVATWCRWAKRKFARATLA